VKLGDETYFLPYQREWILDTSKMRIVEKSRQIGLSYADSYDSVRKAAITGGKDVWVMSRDEVQAKQYILYCKRWAMIMKYAAEDLGEQVLSIDGGKSISVQVLKFASGACIYALTSNPDAIVGKTGHVKLDEFAIHKDQRDLYKYAKPVIQWGGTLSIISTHRGIGTVFNQIIQDIKHRGNPMGWSLHTIPVQKAVEDGIVERINAVTGGHESREAWLARQRAECLDEEQWLQEYCCQPADEASAFITYDLLQACAADAPLLTLDDLAKCEGSLYAGVDIGRRTDLFVLDVGELLGDVMHDRYRLELKGKTFAEMNFELERVLRLPRLRRMCMDATGLGMQLAEEARTKFGAKVEPVTFTASVKESLAYPLKQAFEDRKLRITRDDKLWADIHGIRKETTSAGNIRFAGDAEDSHCDRFWSLALRQHAATRKSQFGSYLI
jgi:phage FluMu gp28-like protein